MKPNKISKPSVPIRQKSATERIAYLYNPPILPYTQARLITEQLTEVMSYPAGSRSANLLLVGDTNNGKTVLITWHAEQYPSYVLKGQDYVRYPVVLIQAPPVPDELRFYNAILHRMGAPFRASEKVATKESQVITLLKNCQVKMLIIDEIHHVLAGSLLKQRAFLNVIKYLANELGLVIVGAGTEEAFTAIHTDNQLSNRFQPLVLHKWVLNEEFQRLLCSLEEWLPLQKPSGLVCEAIAQKLLSMSEGTIGELVALLRQAAKVAIQGKKECITLTLLNELNWLSPSERKRRRL